jgi:hypothetical protein
MGLHRHHLRPHPPYNSPNHPFKSCPKRPLRGLINALL